MKRVGKLLKQLESEGIHLQTADAGAGWDQLSLWQIRCRRQGSRVCRSHPKRLGDFQGRCSSSRAVLSSPGRSLVTRVVEVKRNGKKTFVVTDAAMNDSYAPRSTRLSRDCASQAESREAKDSRCSWTDLRNGDFFAHDRKLAPVEPGICLQFLTLALRNG